MGADRDRADESARQGLRTGGDGDAVVRASQDAAGYALLDAGDGERLEQWGAYRLRRPDTRALGLTRRLPAEAWRAADAHYRGDAGAGAWIRRTPVPDRWLMTHADVTLTIKLAPYKHTGLFPEQAAHWAWMRAQLPPPPAAAADAQIFDDARNGGAHGASLAAATSPVLPEPSSHPSSQSPTRPHVHRPLRVLNLFAYTGGATIALAKAGCHVTHVDASKPALAWAKENARANALPPDAIRWIEDDAVAFVARELRRGRTYDAALLDPPAFGRAPKGRATRAAAGGGLWRIEEHLPALLAEVRQLLPDPLFVLINDYARDAASAPLAALLHQTMRTPAGVRERRESHERRERRDPQEWQEPETARADTPARKRDTMSRGQIEAGRLWLEAANGRRLETGVFARWSRGDAD